MLDKLKNRIKRVGNIVSKSDGIADADMLLVKKVAKKHLRDGLKGLTSDEMQIVFKAIIVVLLTQTGLSPTISIMAANEISKISVKYFDAIEDEL